MRAIIDSDVLIDYLQGIAKARRELERYSKKEISTISWIEVMTGAETAEEKKLCSDFLAGFTVHPLSVEIAAEAVEIRKSFRVRLPDAIVRLLRG